MITLYQYIERAEPDDPLTAASYWSRIRTEHKRSIKEYPYDESCSAEIMQFVPTKIIIIWKNSHDGKHIACRIFFFFAFLFHSFTDSFLIHFCTIEPVVIMVTHQYNALARNILNGGNASVQIKEYLWYYNILHHMKCGSRYIVWEESVVVHPP